jgi:hypothetical protein
MVSPLRNSPLFSKPDLSNPDPSNPDLSNPDADHLRASRAPDRGLRIAAVGLRSPEADNDDLQRLESSVEWLKRQAMIVRPETGQRTGQENLHLPRAVQLPPISGLPAVGANSGRKREVFGVAPPLACERLQAPPRRRHRHGLRGALCLLVAGAIAGSVAYRVSAGGLLSAWEPAQAASLARR